MSLGAGRLVPALTDDTRWPYVVVGVGFAALGLAFVIYGYLRQRAVDAAIAEGGFAPPDDWLVGGLAAVGVLLGLALLLIVVIDT